jgi:murein L,D-transpeptidase YafK
MTDYQMEEIYGLVDEAFKAGQDKVQLQAFPFRMTEENLARHAEDPNAPFWQMLKTRRFCRGGATTDSSCL